MRKDLTASQNDYARFLPALSGFYATYVGKQRYDEYVDKSRIPSNFTHGVESLNYLNKKVNSSTSGHFTLQDTLNLMLTNTRLKKIWCVTEIDKTLGY
jgi:hypothetical protein